MNKSIQNTTATPADVLDHYDATHILNAPFTVILNKAVRKAAFPHSGSEAEVLIPDPDGLIKAVAQARVLNSQKLNGQDLRFLRGALELKSKAFADVIGITPEHMSRLESGDKVLSPQSEMLVRIYVFVSTIPFTAKKEADAEKVAELVTNLFTKLSVVPARPIEKELVLSFERVSSRANTPAVGLCLDADGSWDQPPMEPIAA